MGGGATSPDPGRALEAPSPAPPRGAAPSPAAVPASRGRKARWWLPPLATTAGMIPLAKLAVDAGTGGLGANPIAEGLNRLGFWTLTFLTLSLAVTPAHDLLGLRWPVRIRRTLGLLAFGYAALHFCWYLGVDKFFDLGDISRDVVKRRFITVGFSALLLLVPLAVTSTDRAVRRLGYERWKRLHRLAYVAAGLGVIHFLWRVKADHRKPAVFTVLVVTLLAARVPPAITRRRRRARSPRGAEAGKTG